MKEIVLASSNKGKLTELQRLLGGFDVEVIPQAALEVTDVEETGLSFVENAIIKARNACAETSLPAIADDSGLEVDALDGRPGIYSARFVQGERTMDNYCDALLEAMKGVSEDKRTARFQSVVVFMRHDKDPSPIIAQGTWEGHILTEKIGTYGLGYDPVFFAHHQNCSAGLLPPKEKCKYSHRALAMKGLLAQMQDNNLIGG